MPCRDGLHRCRCFLAFQLALSVLDRPFAARPSLPPSGRASTRGHGNRSWDGQEPRRKQRSGPPGWTWDFRVAGSIGGQEPRRGLGRRQTCQGRAPAPPTATPTASIAPSALPLPCTAPRAWKHRPTSPSGAFRGSVPPSSLPPWPGGWRAKRGVGEGPGHVPFQRLSRPCSFSAGSQAGAAAPSPAFMPAAAAHACGGRARRPPSPHPSPRGPPPPGRSVWSHEQQESHECPVLRAAGGGDWRAFRLLVVGGSGRRSGAGRAAGRTASFTATSTTTAAAHREDASRRLINLQGTGMAPVGNSLGPVFSLPPARRPATLPVAARAGRESHAEAPSEAPHSPCQLGAGRFRGLHEREGRRRPHVGRGHPVLPPVLFPSLAPLPSSARLPACRRWRLQP